MCGISGIVTKQTTSEKEAHLLIERFNKKLQHRGPDAEGYWNNSQLYLGHCRLSIIDLTPLGNQPMSTIDGNYTIIFNGEIYNYREIRDSLKVKGYHFNTSSDTEVIMQAYREWGTDSFCKFNGMFAIALFDKNKNELVLSRDHAGIKPLYYHLNRVHLIFGSEIRIFREFNPEWKENPSWPVHFLSFGFIPFPYTTLDDVLILPKGHFLKVDLNNFSTSMKCFHKFNFTQIINSKNDALEQVRSTLIASLDRHMISDASLGLFLSGGIDSSLLALIADYRKYKDLNTISITFSEDAFSERYYQKLVLSKMTKHSHKEYQVDDRMFMEYLPDILSAMDQPSWDGVNSYFVSKCAHDAGLKVVLSGLGSDELFGGYSTFQKVNRLNGLRLVPSFFKTITSYFDHKINRISFLGLPTNYNEYLFLRGGFNPSSIAVLTGKTKDEVDDDFRTLNLENVPKERNQNLVSFLEANIYMESQLLKDTDCMSMWHSLEIRVPFLDKELMMLSFSIDPKIKYNNSRPKYLITKAFEDLLPAEIIFRKKQGFAFPFDIWLRKNIDFFRSMLQETPLTNRYVIKFTEGNMHWSRIWALVVLKKFLGM